MKEPPDPDGIDTSKFTVVKSTLNQFCNNDFIKQKLNQHVLNSNKLILADNADRSIYTENFINLNWT